MALLDPLRRLSGRAALGRDFPVGLTGCRPPLVRPSPPPCGCVDRVHRRCRERGADAPSIACGLPCRSQYRIVVGIAGRANRWPGNSDGTRRISPLGSDNWAQSASRAISVALVPALRQSTPPRPACNSILNAPIVPSGIFSSGRQLPTFGGDLRGRSSRSSPAFRPFGGDNVTLLAVGIMQQGNPGRAIRIVLDRIDLGGDAVLVAAKVDQPVTLLMPATPDGVR